MDPVTLKLLIEAAVAGGIGLIIGLEREHSDGTGAHSEDHVGVRTLAILALFGWTCALLGDALPWLPPVGLLVAGGLILAHYLRVGDRDLGLTTEVAAATTVALGMLVHHQRDLAVAVGLVVTLLLVAKPWFRRTIPRLRQVELTAALQLAVALAVVLPLLPVEALDPWGALSPRKIGLFIVLLAGVGYVGYVLHRLLGPSRGAVVSGLVGGLVSSTAVTLAMAQQSRIDGRLVRPGRVAVLLANAVMFARVVVVTTFLDRGIAGALALPLGSMAVVVLAAAAWELRRGRLSTDPANTTPLTNPFALLPALRWGILLSVVLVASAVAREQFGDRGLLVAAAASGLADVDAVTLAVGRQSHQGDLTAATASLAITIAVVANSLVKATIAVVLGERGFGRPIAAVLAVAIAVGLIVAWIVR
jgi:uncharacterized membrane protein (DUF4010 family)